jgi:hypothetical protein
VLGKFHRPLDQPRASLERRQTAAATLNRYQ